MNNESRLRNTPNAGSRHRASIYFVFT